MVSTVILFVVVVAFAWNLGVHYTGAVMGMPYAARAISLWPALILIGVMTILGATFASGRVETTVGLNIIDARFVTMQEAIVIVLAGGLLTLLYNYWKIPTSTIQILVFCIVGVGLAGAVPIHWPTIGALAIVWVVAPPVACALGFLFTHLLDLVVPPEAARIPPTASLAAGAADPQTQGALRRLFVRAFPGQALARYRLAEEAAQKDPPRLTRRARVALRVAPGLLALIGVFASFVLGANDVSNATGAFILTHRFSLMVAGFIGGCAMALGALTWGRRILHTVAFDVVKMDLTMASAAQGVQALVVLVAVTQGFFTSMNQALIGAMAGTGLARGRQTVQRKQLIGILRGWLIGPFSGLTLAFALEWLARLIVR